MRTFSSGATRDSDDTKPDYEGFMSPFVIERYGAYMHEHRIQADGALRDSDNWQKGMPKPTYAKSLWRHLLDFWFLHRGHRRFDKKDGHEILIDEALCAIRFNVDGYLHVFLTEKLNGQETTK